MATEHAISVVKNHCYTAPRISKTDRAATTKESIKQEQHKHGFSKKPKQIDTGNDVLAGVSGPDARKSTVGRLGHLKHLDSSLSYTKGDAVSEEQFYENLVRLKDEHKKTLKLLQAKYYDELRNQNSFQWEGFSHGVGLQKQNGLRGDFADISDDSLGSVPQYGTEEDGERVIHKPPKPPATRDAVKDMSRSTISSDQENDSDSVDSVEHDDEVDQSAGLRSPEEFSSSLFPKRNEAIDMVEDLWKDFSVRDYTLKEEETFEKRDSESKNPKQKEWSPAITVPKPFTMTLREATKEKRKTRSMKMVEEELLFKKSMEEAELKKKFRAQPVPATTFLPLYDEITDKNSRRSEHVREINKAILKATEKPFTFIAREEKKRRRKEKDARLAEKQKIKAELQRAEFKAKPPPKYMDDVTLADRVTEQEEYRKIRKKLRAAELLAKSRLPPSMEARANISPAAKSRQKCHRNREDVKKSKFRPNINPDVPDFEALHWEFEKDLRRKKKERQPTVVEPFNLRTAYIPRKSSLRRSRSLENLSRSTDSPVSTGKNRPFSARLSSSQDTLPFGTTESVRLRDSAVRKSLELRKQRDVEISREVKQKRKREKQLRSEVSVKAMANDHSWQLRKTSEEKLRSFRETDRGRHEEYERELAEMRRRISQRPLLLEREAQANARRKAEKKYTQILRDAGVHERLVNELVTNDGNIIDADDSDYDKDPEDEGDLSGTREYPSLHEHGGSDDRDYLSEGSEVDNNSEVESV